MNTQLLVLHEKYGHTYILFDTPEQLETIAFAIVTERNDEGYYEEEPSTQLNNVLAKKAPALPFLKSRDDGEYEGLEIITPLTSKDYESL
jgi:hypothetical protein